MTSIGLGEDGPTHQPVEHLAALRAIPNLLVFRPADSVETRRVLGAGAARQTDAVDPGADPPERCRCCAPTHTDENLSRPRRLCAGRAERQARRDPDRAPAPKSRSRSRRAKALEGEGIARRRRLHAVLGTVRGAGREPIATRCWARRRASRSRPRSVRLGALARRRRRLYRHARIRRLGARRKTSISISASPPRPSPPQRRDLVGKTKR